MNNLSVILIIQLLLVLSVIFIMLDMYLHSGVLSLVAYGFLSISAASLSRGGVGMQLLLACCILVPMYLYHQFLRQRVVAWLKKAISFIMSKGGLGRGLVGKQGTIKSIDGARYISVEGKLYKCQSISLTSKKLGEKHMVKEDHGDILYILTNANYITPIA